MESLHPAIQHLREASNMSDIGMVLTSFFSRRVAVPPVDIISTPCVLSPFANSTMPSLFETLIKALSILTKRKPPIIHWPFKRAAEDIRPGVL